jgi:hypothetical protein
MNRNTDGEKPVDQGEGADCAERLLLAEVVDRDAVRGTVAEKRLDQLGEVPCSDRDAVEPVVAQLADDDVEHRPVPDRHQRLRQDGRVRLQARTEAAGEHNGAARGGRLGVVSLHGSCHEGKRRDVK